jgi:Ca2+-binding EF-hand superfamily protein
MVAPILRFSKQSHSRLAACVATVLLAACQGGPLPVARQAGLPPTASISSVRLVRALYTRTLERTFVRSDLNKNGSLSQPEFPADWPETHHLAFADLDANSDGQLTRPEWFGTANMRALSKQSHEVMRFHFDGFDRDSNHRVTGAELEAFIAFGELGPAEAAHCRTTFQRADRNRNTELTVSEFEDFYIWLYDPGHTAG